MNPITPFKSGRIMPFETIHLDTVRKLHDKAHSLPKKVGHARPTD